MSRDSDPLETHSNWVILAEEDSTLEEQVMPLFNPRPGDTKEGRVDRNPGGPETVEFKDALLWDFDIDGDELKSAHLAYLDEAMRFMFRVRNFGSGRSFKVWSKGKASRTGGDAHNYQLSVIRQGAVQTTLEDALRLPGNSDLVGMVDFSHDWVGFRESPPGENPKFRAVRLTITRAPAPPPPISIVPAGSTQWRATLVANASIQIPIPKIPVGPQGDEVLVQIEDTSAGPAIGGRVGLFSYSGIGVGVSIPKIGKVDPGKLGPISGGGLGKPFDFNTTDPVLLKDFVGDASLMQPPGVLSVSLGSALLAIQSHSFMMKECHTIVGGRQADIELDGLNVIINVLSTSKGTLKLIMVDGKFI